MKSPVKPMLTMMSKDSRGAVTFSGRPMRHLPSILEISAIGQMKAMMAMIPKPRQTTVMQISHTLSDMRRL